MFQYFVFSKMYNQDKMSMLALSIEKCEYWLKISVFAYEHVNPALLDVLHNDGPYPDTTYIGLPRDPKLLYIHL